VRAEAVRSDLERKLPDHSAPCGHKNSIAGSESRRVPGQAAFLPRGRAPPRANQNGGAGPARIGPRDRQIINGTDR
jgi:hypothetical protein